MAKKKKNTPAPKKKAPVPASMKKKKKKAASPVKSAASGPPLGMVRGNGIISDQLVTDPRPVEVKLPGAFNSSITIELEDPSVFTNPLHQQQCIMRNKRRIEKAIREHKQKHFRAVHG